MGAKNDFKYGCGMMFIELCMQNEYRTVYVKRIHQTMSIELCTYIEVCSQIYVHRTMSNMNCVMVLIELCTTIDYRVANTHRMPYLYRSFSAKERYNQWLFCGKQPTTSGILWVFATLQQVYTHTYTNQICLIVYKSTFFTWDMTHLYLTRVTYIHLFSLKCMLECFFSKCTPSMCDMTHSRVT